MQSSRLNERRRMLNIPSSSWHIGIHNLPPVEAHTASSAQVRVEKPTVELQEPSSGKRHAKGVFRPSIGLAKFMQNQLFGNETERRYVENSVKAKINIAIHKKQLEPITIKGQTGKLEGYYYKSYLGTKTGKVALVLSGSAAPSEMHTPAIADKYQRNGVDVLAVNYRGFGRSEGTPSEQGLYQDAEAMFLHLTQTLQIPAESIILHGYSMGGPIAAHLASNAKSAGHNVAGLILDRPMPSTSKATRAHHPKIGGIAGQIAKKSVGVLSVEKNLSGELKNTKILIMTDKERMGKQGEKLRDRLLSGGFSVTGTAVNASHVESDVVMENQFGAIKDAFLPPSITQLGPPSPVHRDAPAMGLQDEFMKEFGYLKDYL
jgi:RTX toxin RtxA